MTCPACPVPCGPALEQPHGAEFIGGGVFVKQMLVKHSGTIVPQHAHAYDHMTLVMRGEVGVWSGNQFIGFYAAPASIVIRANVLHEFVTETDDVECLCIHPVTQPVQTEANACPGL